MVLGGLQLLRGPIPGSHSISLCITWLMPLFAAHSSQRVLLDLQPGTLQFIADGGVLLLQILLTW
jgi:hypothetical protein